MKKFEYEYLTVVEREFGEEYYFKGMRFMNSLVDVLNHIGEDGWQLVCLNGNVYIMMREVVQDDN